MHGLNFGMGGMWMSLLWWVVIAGAIYLLVKFLANRNNEKRFDESALSILKKRYAKSEISKEEFEKKRRDLA